MAENINPNSDNMKKEEEEKTQKMEYSFNAGENNEIDKKNSNKHKNENQYRKSVDKGKNLGTFILGQKLGEGTFGLVRIATHILTGEKVAVKILDRQKIKDSDKKRIEREIKILKIMHHNNIVRLYDVINTSTTIYLVMEYIDGKELFDYIVHKRRLSELEACKFYQQLLSCIEYLSKLKIAHRDLKPENLILDKKKNIKLVDFGLSNIYKNNELLSTPCGSPSYAAPEMLRGEKYNGLNVDIWSSGIVLYAMICGCLPFEHPNNDVLYNKIKEGVFRTPEFISDNANDFLHRILNIDPNKRYNIEQIKAHPWFNIINPKIYMSEGLLINTYIVPIDEEIIDKMANEYEFNSIEIRINLLANKHNHLTNTYYLLLKKKLNKGGRSISNTSSTEFKNYIKNPKNLLSNYNGNWKQLFKDRAGDKHKKIEENKINDEKKENIINIDNLEKDNINNKDNNLYNSIKSYLYNKSKQNDIENLKQSNINNEVQKQNKVYNNSIKNNEFINSKNDIEENSKKKPTIFEYLKKIKGIKNENNYKEENKNSNYNLESKQQKTPKKEKNSHPNGIYKTEKKNQLFKDDKKTKINNTTNNNNSITKVKINTIDKEYPNQKKKKIFDIHQYLNKKKKNNSLTENINNDLAKNNNINFDLINNYCNTERQVNNKDDEIKNDINHFSTIDNESSPLNNKIKKRKFIRHKYVESRYFNSKNSNSIKENDILNNSFNNLNNYNTSNNYYNKKRNKNLNENEINNNKTIYINNSKCKKHSESSLNKRKKYSETVNSNYKKVKKIKINDNNKYMLKNNKNLFLHNNTIEYKENSDTFRKINSDCLNTLENKSRNLDTSFGVNYIIEKKNIKNGLFNSKNFNNTSISFEINNNSIIKDKSLLKKNEYKKDKNNKSIYNNKNNNNIINRTYNNSPQKFKSKKSDNNNIINKIKEKDRFYIKLSKNNQVNNRKSKKINLNNNTNMEIKNNRNQKINKSKSIENYEDKNKKSFLVKKLKINSLKLQNSIINSKKIIKNYISNTQRDSKYNKKRRAIIKNKLDSNDDILIKSYADIYQDKTHSMTFNQNELNLIMRYDGSSIKKEFKKFNYYKKDGYIPFYLNNIVLIDNKNILNQKIKKELEYKNIKYTIKNNKYICWRKDSKLIFDIKKIDESNNCHVINVNISKQKKNFFNISFCKEFFKNIVNKNYI